MSQFNRMQHRAKEVVHIVITRYTPILHIHVHVPIIVPNFRYTNKHNGSHKPPDYIKYFRPIREVRQAFMVCEVGLVVFSPRSRGVGREV